MMPTPELIMQPSRIHNNLVILGDSMSRVTTNHLFCLKFRKAEWKNLAFYFDFLIKKECPFKSFICSYLSPHIT